MDPDTWILEAGNELIEARSEGRDISDIENLIYMIWVLDYAVRNAGSRDTLADFSGFNSDDFSELCSSLDIAELTTVLDAENDAAFCERYYDLFEPTVEKLKELYELKG